jgi:hydrogenase-4 component B
MGALRSETSLGPAWAIPSLTVVAALALIGGLAAVCFTKVVGIAFLGEPRTEAAAAAHAPGMLMTLPMVVLAAGCFLVGIRPAQVVRPLLHVVSQVGRMETATIASQFETAIEPLGSITLASIGLIALALALAVVRRVLLSGRSVAASGTWGCGYTRPTPRMQYTSSSYVQPAVFFFTPLFRLRRALVAPLGLFPKEAAFSSEISDPANELLYRPAFRLVGRLLAGLRWLQRGYLHVYMLYIGVTLVALLIWYIGIHLRSG